MKIKIAALSGYALDWAVACYGEYKGRRVDFGSQGIVVGHPPDDHGWFTFAPSTDWSQGGPIIEREDITVGPNTRPVLSNGNYRYRAHPLDPEGESMYGPTPLIAAMRCFAATRLGDAVEVPDELL